MLQLQVSLVSLETWGFISLTSTCSTVPPNMFANDLASKSLVNPISIVQYMLLPCNDDHFPNLCHFPSHNLKMCLLAKTYHIITVTQAFMHFLTT